MINNKTIRQVVINKALLPCTPGELTYIEAQTVEGGGSITFNTNIAADITDLHVDIVPQQSGTGDPSSDNVRPISGTDTLSFIHGIVSTPPVAPTIINISLGDTVYGGYYDNDTGEVWATYEVVTLDGTEATWGSSSSYDFRFQIPTMKNGDSLDGLAEWLKTWKNSSETNPSVRFGANTNYLYFYHIIGNIEGVTGVANWKTYLANHPLKLAYPLATPVKIATIQPTEIISKVGKQKIQSSNKFGFSLKYPIMVGGSCELAKQFLPIFYPNGKGVNHNGSTF